MLGFGPVGQIPVAGSPLVETVSYDLFAEGGRLAIRGQPVSLQYDVSLDAGSGVLAIHGDETSAVIDYTFGLESSNYYLVGKPARIFVSFFGYTDSEMIRVPAEVRMMYVPHEHRRMNVKGVPDDTLVKDEVGMSAPPRLRRT